MKLSDKRRQAIYAAVHDEIVKLRIKLRNDGVITDTVDYLIAQAGTRAGEAAIKTAEGGHNGRG